jgi:hypothetical protein
LAALVVRSLRWGFRQRGARPVLSAWGFFVVALVPVLGFTDVYFMTYSLVADQYQHLALIGVIVSVCAAWTL